MYEIEDGDSVRLKSEKYRMIAKKIDIQMVLCSFNDIISKVDKEEWIKIQDLILVEKKYGDRLEIEIDDVVRLKSEKFLMEVMERENDGALCCFYDVINEVDKEEWINVADLILVKEVDGGFVRAGQVPDN